MANTLNLGNGNWGVKKDSLLGYNSENGNFKPLAFNFTRASSATVVNKAGLIETVGGGEPRIDFSNDAKGALLLEPTRSNLVTYSEDFSQGYWTKTNTNVTSGFLSPDGTNNAFKLISNNGGNIIARPSTSSNTNHATSIYLKRVSGNGNVSIFKTNGNEQIITLTDEWQRFTDINSVNPSNAYMGVRLYGLNDEILIFGAQVEQGSYATSYIPNFGNSAGATRVAETAIDGGAEAPIFSNTSAVWFINFSRFGYDSSINSAAITLNNSSNVEQIRFHFDQPTQTVRFRDAKNSFSNIGVSINTFSNIRKKVALKIDGTTLKVFSDGQQIGSDYTRPNAFDINSMDLQSSAFNLFETKFYNTALTDAELQALTQ